MVRRIFKLLFFGALAAFLLHFWIEKQANSTSEGGRAHHLPAPTFSRTATANHAAPRAAETWGNLASLPDHLARHGSDFGATSAEDYARMAREFLQRAKAEGLPAKVDGNGSAARLRSAQRRIRCLQSQWHDQDIFQTREPRLFRSPAGPARQPANLETMRHTCPVCGFPKLKETPRTHDGGGSYEICPSCGFQFGVSDDDRGFSYEQWRERWQAAA